jgi:hypothetical protein
MTETCCSIGRLLDTYGWDTPADELVAAMRADGLPEYKIEQVLEQEVHQLGDRRR